MKDEIKEIVVDNGELIAYYKDGSFQAFDTLLQEVLDYITNLQEENEELKDIVIEKEDYKSRNEKAIEYCDREIGNIIANFEYIDTTDLENVRKILQGKDKEIDQLEK